MLKNEKGSAIVAAVLAFAVLFMISMSFIMVGTTNRQLASKEEYRTKAYYVAKTGLDSTIKHLENEGNAGDMRDRLEKLVERTANNNPLTGEFDGQDFEIEVMEGTRKNEDGENKAVYLMTSIGYIGEGDKSKRERDQTTAVLFPEYERDDSWGNGTIDASGTVYIDDLDNLQGEGLEVNSEQTKKVGARGEVTVNKARGKEIIKLFENYYNADINGFALRHRLEENGYLLTETLEHEDGGKDKLKINYNIPSFRPKPTFEVIEGRGSNIDLKNAVIDAKNPTPGVSKLVTEEYKVIEFDLTSGEPSVVAKNKEFLKINTSRLQIEGGKNNKIITDPNIDIVIYADTFTIFENTELHVEGDGRVYIFVKSSSDISNGGRMGIELDKKVEYRPVNTNIHFYLGDHQISIQNNSELGNAYLYGLSTRVELKENAIFTGKMTSEAVSFNNKFTINSPTAGAYDEETSPIIGFKSKEWER